MHFQLTHPLPEHCVVAVSGGVDSVSAFHFLSQVDGRVAGIVHINHASGQFADDAEELVRELGSEYKTNLTVRSIQGERGPGESREDFWRSQRYRFFWDEYALSGLPIVLAHNMDDCLEEYIVCTMIRGHLGTIPYQHGCCVRPFRLWKRHDIVQYAKEHQLRWLEDPSNSDYSRFLRAKVRQLLAPRVRFVNPGIYKVVENAIREQDKWDKNEGL